MSRVGDKMICEYLSRRAKDGCKPFLSEIALLESHEDLELKQSEITDCVHNACIVAQVRRKSHAILNDGSDDSYCKKASIVLLQQFHILDPIDQVNNSQQGLLTAYIALNKFCY